jgi:hypothetical protein
VATILESERHQVAIRILDQGCACGVDKGLKLYGGNSSRQRLDTTAGRVLTELSSKPVKMNNMCKNPLGVGR